MTPTRLSLNCNFAAANFLDPIFTFTRPSNATRINPQTGLIETLAPNIPRLEKDGLLIEGAATNLIPKANFEGGAGDQPSWFVAPAGAMLLSDDLPRFAGALVARHRRAGADTNVGYCDSSGQSGAHVFAVDLWLPSGQDVSGLRIDAEWNASGVAVLTPVNPAMRDCWQRTAVGFNRISNGASVATILRCEGGGCFYSRAWQVEPGPVATSYIPTTGAPATRAAETCFIEPGDFTPWWNPATFTICCEASWGTISSGFAFDFPLKSGTPGVGWGRNEGQMTVSNGGNVTGIQTSERLVRIAITQNNQGAIFSSSGAGVANLGYPNVQEPIGRVSIGAHRYGILPLNGHIRTLQILPHDVSAGVLAAMSAQ